MIGWFCSPVRWEWKCMAFASRLRASCLILKYGLPKLLALCTTLIVLPMAKDVFENPIRISSLILRTKHVKTKILSIFCKPRCLWPTAFLRHTQAKPFLLRLSFIEGYGCGRAPRSGEIVAEAWVMIMVKALNWLIVRWILSIHPNKIIIKPLQSTTSSQSVISRTQTILSRAQLSPLSSPSPQAPSRPNYISFLDMIRVDCLSVDGAGGPQVTQEAMSMPGCASIRGCGKLPKSHGTPNWI